MPSDTPFNFFSILFFPTDTQNHMQSVQISRGQFDVTSLNILSSTN